MAIRAFALLVLFSCSPPAVHAQPPPESVTPELGADTVPATVTQVATLIDREYMDHAVAARLSDHLRRRLADGAYARAATPEALATQLTRDLFAESQDKHLAVTLVRPPAAPLRGLPRAKRMSGGPTEASGASRSSPATSGTSI